MFSRKKRVLQRKNYIFILGSIFLVMAILEKPSFILFFTSIERMISMILILIAALLATLGVYHLGRSIFGRNNSQWHTKSPGTIWHVVGVIIFSILITAFDHLHGGILGTGQYLIPRAYLYLFTAFELLWIFLLSWFS